MNKDDIDSNDWIEYTDSFFALVKLGCDEIDNPRHSDKFGDIKIEYKDRINIAIMYNMKHAVELYLKTLIRIVDGDNIENIRNLDHDLTASFKVLKNKLEDKEIEKVIFSLKNNKDELMGFAKQELNRVTEESMLNDIKKIVSYYNNFEFFTKNTGKLDKKNTAFKYPENDLSESLLVKTISFNYESLDIEQIRKDVGVLEAWLFSINSIFNIYHRFKKEA
jgi:hypothetical protein